MASTTTIAGGAGIGMQSRLPTYYSKLLIKYLFPKMKYHQFGEARPIPRRSGKQVIWGQYAAPTADTALTEGVAPSAASLSTISVSSLLEQYGYVIGVTDLLEMTAIDSQVEAAVEHLSDRAAITVDTATRNSILDAATKYIELPSAGTAVGAVTALGSAHVLDEYVVRKLAYTRLRRLNVQPFSDGYYVGVVHPLAGEQLISDSAWQDWYKYVNPDAAYRGEIGKIHGVRFVDSTNVYLGSAVQTSGPSVSGAYNMIFGKQFYGVTDFDGGVHVYVKGPNKYDKSDPLDQYSTIGYKVTYASKVLNPSCGVIVPTGVLFI